MKLTLWDHFGKSLPLPAKIFLALSTFIAKLLPADATSVCSNSFRFDQLCPDPRFGSRESGASGNHQPDTYILLHSNNNRRAGGGTISSHYGSMSIKDPSTTSCDFHRNGVETAVVAAVHVTENPWNFRHANACTNIVKLSYDLYESGGNQGQIGRTGGTSSSLNNKSGKICNNEIGIRRHGSTEDTDAVAANDELADELARKTNVYFWHNFTLYPHSGQFVDTITNYHLSKEDVSCADGGTGQYVQIAVVVSKSGRCEIIVQQYKIEEKRSPWGCTGSGYPIPYPIQFCGTYECSQSITILTGLKLLSRRDGVPVGSLPKWNYFDGKGSPSKGSGHGQPAQHGHIKGESDGATALHPDYDYGNQPDENQLPPCVTEMTTTISPDEEGLEGEETKPMDWKEIIFLSGFPVCGIFFILIVLNILRSHSAREICRGYPYPRPVQSLDQTSCNSIDKSLPM